MGMRCLILALISSSSLAVMASHEEYPVLGPYKGLTNPARSSPQNPSCVWFTLQDNLPEETVQIITYGAPEVSTYLAMSLAGDQKTFPQRGQTVRAHYTLFLDDCTLIESSRDNDGQPFEFVTGIGQVIKGWEGAIPPNATLIFDIEIVGIV